MKKKPPATPLPLAEPFEDVHLAGELALLRLTPEIASVRISRGDSTRAYSLNLPVYVLRDWVLRVDAALAESNGERPQPLRPDPMMREMR